MTVALMAVFSLLSPLVLAQATNAAVDPKKSAEDGFNAAGGGGGLNLGQGIEVIVNLLMFVLGAIAVIVIVIGGIRYATSNGDSGQIKSAKDTILYAVVGLVVALLAYAIVRFVLNQFVPAPANP